MLIPKGCRVFVDFLKHPVIYIRNSEQFDPVDRTKNIPHGYLWPTGQFSDWNIANRYFNKSVFCSRREAIACLKRHLKVQLISKGETEDYIFIITEPKELPDD